MIKGLDYFREYFRDFQNSYVLIGGVACHLAMEEAGIEFRATKDLDIVLCAELMDAAFAARFWEFVKAGKYQHQEKSTGEKQYYRFSKPANGEFPFMLELFSRKLDELVLNENNNLTPIPFDEDVASLSAILLDKDYYQCIENGKLVMDGISILGPEYILPFKAHAWLDLTAKQTAGQQVDSKNIKKHRNDVFRIFPLLSPEQTVDVAAPIKAHMRKFVEAMRNEQGLNIKDFGINQQSLEQVLANLESIYRLEQV